MRCQICNKQTSNFEKNEYTGKYESICNKCKNLIRSTKVHYTDIEESIADRDDLSDVEIQQILKGIDDEYTRQN